MKRSEHKFAERIYSAHFEEMCRSQIFFNVDYIGFYLYPLFVSLKNYSVTSLIAESVTEQIFLSSTSVIESGGIRTMTLPKGLRITP